MATGSRDGEPPSKKMKTECEFKEDCYRQNPKHFEEFSHPHLDELVAQMPEDEIKFPPNYKQKISRRILELQIGFHRQLKKTGSAQPKIAQLKKTSTGQQAGASLPLIVNSSSKQREPAHYSNKPSASQSKTESPRPSQSKGMQSSTSKTEAENYRTVVLDRVKSNIADKWEKAAPYHFFLSAISDSKPTHNDPLTVHFPELLDPRLGDLKSSLQINFMVQLGWLLAQYHIMGHRGKPMTLLYSEGDEYLTTSGFCPPHVTPVKVTCPSPFGKHHTKMCIMAYKDDSLRVIVSTGNLVESDWDNRVQGVWIGPRCPPLPEDSDTGAGDSPTQFKKDLLQYLTSYNLPNLQEWIGHVRRTDFSAVRVFFVASVPGTHAGLDYEKWSQGKVASILKKHSTITPASAAGDWRIIAQCSSIGSLGPDASAWLAGQIKLTLSCGRGLIFPSSPSISVIYPTFKNVSDSHDGLLGGGCLPYTRQAHSKQLWFHRFLNQWKADRQHRTRSMPHIKTYCRVSPDYKRIAWFLLTSANLSKAAWGNSRSPMKNYTMSYEAGVMFIPKFLVKEDYFPIEEDVSREKNIPVFPMPYDLPLVPYNSSDLPWFMDHLS